MPELVGSLLLEAGIITFKQIALVRLGILAIVGLFTWAIYHTFEWIENNWLELTLAWGYTAAAAFLTSCWILGRLAGRIGFWACLLLFLHTLKEIFLGFFNKEGIILNICFFLIPLVLPIYLLRSYALSSWWGLLLFPIGVLVGTRFHSKLDADS